MRLCDEDQGWLEPDLFNCTSPAFRELSLLVRLCPASALHPRPSGLWWAQYRPQPLTSWAFPNSVQAFLPVRLLRNAYRTTEKPLPSLSWQLDGLELNKTALDTVEAKKLAQRLREVTGQTDYYFSQDVRVTARLLAYLLAFESHQQGFGLTATQDAHFNEVGCVLSVFPSLCPDPQLHSSSSLAS